MYVQEMFLFTFYKIIPKVLKFKVKNLYFLGMVPYCTTMHTFDSFLLHVHTYIHTYIRVHTYIVHT